MGFFYCAPSASPAPRAAKGVRSSGISVETMRTARCTVCSLNAQKLKHPKMVAHGATKPLVYVLGQSPDSSDDRQGQYFSGNRGRVIRDIFIAAGFDESRLRFNNTIRCAPPDARAPYPGELECCRGFLEEDISAHLPKVIVGIGAGPLQALKPHKAGIAAWRGRLTPILVGGEACWFFPILDADAILDTARGRESEENPLWHITVLDLIRLRKWLTKEYQEPRVHSRERVVKGVECLVDFDQVQSALRYFMKSPSTAIDLETSAKPVRPEFSGSVFHPQAPGAKILSAALANGERVVSFPLEWSGAWSKQEYVEVHRSFKKFLLAGTTKIAFNLPFELTWLDFFYGSAVLTGSTWDDAMVQAHVLDERKGMLSLGTQTYLEYGVDIKSLSLANVRNLESETLSNVLLYNGVDAKYTYSLWKRRRPSIKQNKLQAIEAHLVRTARSIARMQNKGILVDTKRLHSYESKVSGKVKTLSTVVAASLDVRKVRGKTGREFNPGSPRDLKVLLVDVLKRPEVWVQQRDGTKKVSTEDSILARIKLPVVKQIQALRKAEKLLGTYLVGIRNVVYEDGCLHPSINVMLTSTGRLSYNDPNMQNFPKRRAEAKFTRNIIRPRPGHILLAADYGQIEARCIAMASGDEAFIDALWKDFDIHMYWAEELHRRYGRIKDWVMSELVVEDESKWLKVLRSEMKNRWVFPLFYGSSYTSCARSLNIPEALSRTLADEFWGMFKGVKKWQAQLERFYLKYGYVETLTGRRRYGPLDRGRVINSPIQGTASDIVVDASNRLVEAEIVPLFNIHDDLTFEVPIDSVKKESYRIAKIMCSSKFEFMSVPVVIEMETGMRWGKMEKLREFHSDRDFGITRSN